MVACGIADYDTEGTPPFLSRHPQLSVISLYGLVGSPIPHAHSYYFCMDVLTDALNEIHDSSRIERSYWPAQARKAGVKIGFVCDLVPSFGH